MKVNTFQDCKVVVNMKVNSHIFLRPLRQLCHSWASWLAALVHLNAVETTVLGGRAPCSISELSMCVRKSSPSSLSSVKSFEQADTMTVDCGNSFPEQKVRPGGSTTKPRPVVVTKSMFVFNQSTLASHKQESSQ